MRLGVARHVALDLSAFDVMTLAHAWQGVKDFVMGYCGVVSFQLPACASHDGAADDVGAKLDARDGQSWGSLGYTLFR